MLAEELARRAALSIDNGRLFESTRHLARTLQQGLLPRKLPEIPGVNVAGRYRAAAEGQEVGGDFYDAFDLDGGGWGIVIGDVCGKGPEAAALTALARYTVRALSEHSPATVMTRLNTAVLRGPRAEEQRFLTACYIGVRLSDDGLLLDVVAAGHPPPLILRSEGRSELIDAAGPLVGVVAGAEYRAVPAVLEPGDTLVLYTDGLTDARAPARVLSSSDLLRTLAECQGVDAEGIAAHLEAFAVGDGDGEPRDDIALLVVQMGE